VFSRRTGWVLTPNLLHKALEHRQRSKTPFIDLTLSNPTVAGLQWADGEGLRAALSSPEILSYAPEPFGSIEARAALSTWFSRRGLPIPPEQLCLTASTSEAYSFLFKLLCDPGDVVLVPSPSYPLFDYLTGLEGVTLRPYELRYDGEWHIDLASLDEALSRSEGASGSQLRAIVALHPNNPTGHYLKPAEFDALVDRCATHGLALISDEVFYEHGLAEQGITAPRAATHRGCLCFSLGGLSKLAGLPQIKLGWIAASGPELILTEALGRLEIIADSALSVGAPAQLALPYVLRRVDGFLAEVDARLRRNLGALDQALGEASAATRLRCEGGWSALLRLPLVRSSEDWAIHLLEQHDVLVQPGYFFGLASSLHPDSYVVVSLLCPEDPFSSGVSKLAEAVG
jgi:alanine-synthesizing transaminase